MPSLRQTPWYRRPLPVVPLLGLTALLVGAPLPSEAHLGDSIPSAVHACVNAAGLGLRIVGETGSCSDGQTPVHWPALGVLTPVSILTGGFGVNASLPTTGGTTLFMGPGVVSDSTNTGSVIDPGLVAVPLPAGLASNLRVHVLRIPRAPDVTLTFTVKNTASPNSTLECSVGPLPFPATAQQEQTCENPADQLIFSAGDRLYLVVSSSTPGLPIGGIDTTSITWSVEFRP